MIEIVSDTEKDWASTWRASPSFGEVTKEIERIVKDTSGIRLEDPEEHNEFASTTVRARNNFSSRTTHSPVPQQISQFKLVLKRASIQVSQILLIKGCVHALTHWRIAFQEHGVCQGKSMLGMMSSAVPPR